MSNYLAFDLGAESGRAILGTVAAGKLQLEELHRFANTPVRVLGALYWDTLRLWHEIQYGLGVAVRDRKLALDGIGVDTWGVDYGLLGADGQLLDSPRHYRDARTDGMMDRVFAQVPRDQVFGYTGIQFMQLNTLYQLFAQHTAGSPALASARTLLNMPDLFNYFLTGVARSEITIASTTQFFDPRTMSWSKEMLGRLGIPTGMLGELVEPGTRLGTTLEAPHVPVYAVAGHDTAAAVAAVPAAGGDHWCYISSGTWSLMGVELDQPVINEQSLAMNYTNEVGVARKIRLLKNIAGLWLLQECRRQWILEGTEYSYAQLAGMAAAARPFSAVINPDAFLAPGDMPRKIDDHCRATGQESPRTHGEYARAILESLALRYRQVVESLEVLSGRTIETIHIVGGGSRNTVLNQFVADCTGRTVIAGPGEATAIGNVLTQMMGSGEISGLDQARELVRRSFEVTTVAPRSPGDWDSAWQRYQQVTGQSA